MTRYMIVLAICCLAAAPNEAPRPAKPATYAELKAEVVTLRAEVARLKEQLAKLERQNRQPAAKDAGPQGEMDRLARLGELRVGMTKAQMLLAMKALKMQESFTRKRETTSGVFESYHFGIEGFLDVVELKNGVIVTITR